jgi:hypothetical protein
MPQRTVYGGLGQARLLWKTRWLAEIAIYYAAVFSGGAPDH